MSIRKSIAVVLAVAGLVLGAPAHAAGPNMKPGMWETTVKMQVQGMAMEMPAVTTRNCITEEDLVPKTQKNDGNCKILNQDISGDTVSWHLRCEDDGQVTEGRGRATYHGDTYEGSVDIKTTGGGMGDMQMTQQISGRRIGPCE